MGQYSGVYTTRQQMQAVAQNTWVGSYITTGLVAYWDANNSTSYPGSGATWYTTAGGVDNAMTLNNVTYTSGSAAYFSFDGSSSYASQNSPVNLPTTGDSTVLIWCKPDSTGPSNQYTGLVSYGGRSSTSPSNSRLLSLYTSGTTMYVSSAYWGNDYTPNNLAVTANAWNMVGMVARGAGGANNTTLYSGNAAGGLLSVTGTSSSSSRTLNTTLSNLGFGTTDYPGRLFKGFISIVMIYNRELSLSEITTNYNSLKTRFNIA